MFGPFYNPDFHIGVPRDAQWYIDNDIELTTKILAIFGLKVVPDDDPTVEDGIVRVEPVEGNTNQIAITPFDDTLSLPASERRTGRHSCYVKTIDVPQWWEHNEYDRDVLGEVCRYLNIPVTQFTTRDAKDNTHKTITVLTDFTTDAIAHYSCNKDDFDEPSYRWDAPYFTEDRRELDLIVKSIKMDTKNELLVDSYYVGDVPDVLRILAQLVGAHFEPHQTSDHNVIWILYEHSITDNTLANLRPFLDIAARKKVVRWLK